METIIHISDLSLGLSFPILHDTSENLIKKVQEEHSDANLFLININYKTENIARADNAGILFLKYLRLNHFNQHCVLYSFLSREQLMMQDPLNSIIFSEGVTFIRMPEDLSKVNFELLIKKQAPDNLNIFFKVEFRLPDDRHFFANWWGVLQLWIVQKAVERIAGKKIITDIESGFAGSLKAMYSYDGLVARYVKGIHDSDVESTLKMLIFLKTERFKNYAKTRNQVQQEIENDLSNDHILEIQQNTLDELSHEEENKLFLKLKSLFSSLPTSLQRKIKQVEEKRSELKDRIKLNQEYINLLAIINKEKEHIYDEKRKLNRQIQSKIDTLISCNSFLTQNYSLDIIRQNLAEKKPSILFVDDQANDGWAAIFQRMLYGGNDDTFTVIQPEKDDSIENIVHSIEKMVKVKKINLLILDLRLKGETGHNLNINEISGICVLEKLIANHLPCPVLITSASNKIWSYRETLKLGADAYWIKEGLDDNYSLELSIENYLRLMDLIYSLCFKEEYRFLYDKLLPAILKIKNSTTLFWWETKFWKQDSFTYKRNETTIKVNKLKPVAREEIIDSLNAGFDLFKKYLSEKIQKNETINISRYVGSLVIIQFSRVLEIIHRFDASNDRFSLSEKMQAQLDEPSYNFFSKLITIRNSATHNFSADFTTITNFIEPFISYLTSNILDIPTGELIKYENIQAEPVKDEWYSSVITSKDTTYDNKYYLSNPNIKLKNGRTHIVLDLRFNKELITKELRLGDKVKYQLKINENNGVFYYFACNTQIIQ
ncbi:MAG: hypothetical protein A2266_09250 [Bacteroidetes bacterium RIFOXYA12_FULL_40_10]|nr:MAG: hypothetical protein US49_C0004G0028 [candidate division TM6 bacterium GW2011_GWF2_37_49]OFY91352.1 MAG: hypothetical protein A2266_09250 [Bacteroidetes bacterium RIFOXYA12_FULL_40_10]HBG62227.1 hypothetical protein [Candidatus Omnitrophota bacterium]